MQTLCTAPQSKSQQTSQVKHSVSMPKLLPVKTMWRGLLRSVRNASCAGSASNSCSAELLSGERTSTVWDANMFARVLPSAHQAYCRLLFTDMCLAVGFRLVQAAWYYECSCKKEYFNVQGSCSQKIHARSLLVVLQSVTPLCRTARSWCACTSPKPSLHINAPLAAQTQRHRARTA